MSSITDTFCLYDPITDKFFALVAGYDDSTGRTAHGAWYDKFSYWYSNPLLDGTGGVFTVWPGPVHPMDEKWTDWLDGHLEVKRALLDIKNDDPYFNPDRLRLIYVDEDGSPDFSTGEYPIRGWEEGLYESL